MLCPALEGPHTVTGYTKGSKCKFFHSWFLRWSANSGTHKTTSDLSSHTQGKQTCLTLSDSRTKVSQPVQRWIQSAHRPSLFKLILTPSKNRLYDAIALPQKLRVGQQLVVQLIHQQAQSHIQAARHVHELHFVEHLLERFQAKLRVGDRTKLARQSSHDVS